MKLRLYLQEGIESAIRLLGLEEMNVTATTPCQLQLVQCERAELARHLVTATLTTSLSITRHLRFVLTFCSMCVSVVIKCRYCRTV